MDKNEKFVRSLSKEDRARITEALSRVRSGEVTGLDFKKLKGRKNLFRIRVGDFRVICAQHPEYGFIVLDVGRKNDTTYTL